MEIEIRIRRYTSGGNNLKDDVTEITSLSRKTK